MTAAAFPHPELLVEPRRRTILGVAVAPMRRRQAIARLQDLLAQKLFTRVGFLNAHTANLAHTDPEFAASLGDFLILPDGIGVDLASKLLYGEAFPENLNGTDFVPAFLASVGRPLRVGLIGAKAHHGEGAAAALRHAAPQHSVFVVHHGFFSPEEEPLILERIKTLHLDVLLVAMGVPRQELWITRKIGPEHCLMPIAVGALLDFLSGAVPRAPLWLRRLRMEWLFRLALEPVRLWRRYVLGNPLFLYRVCRQKRARATPDAATS
ncbi:MAG: WecB/TagA/CpsF family glycosyltransferase [Methylobacterium mesophilicum]|nr:WecB/TagA/CpsF family glycosyltransferase [Methylobacterium mesophilicum]